MPTDRIPLDGPAATPNLRKRKDSTGPIDTAELERELRRSVEGEVRFDQGSRAMYAVDGSNYRQVPIAVVVPRSQQDVINTVAACRSFGAPLLSRGGGTSLAGQCCNVAVVMDWTKYMNRILELNSSECLARVEPGVICDSVRKAAAPYDLTWGPDPATHDHCAFGGMLGNNSCGAHAQMSGKAADNTEALDILLYDGTRMSVGWMDDAELNRRSAHEGRAGKIYRDLKSLRDRYAGLIERNYPKIPRRVSGYNLDQLIPGADGRFNLARALVGTEGTCVTYLEAQVRLVPARAQRVVLLLGYPDIYRGADHITEILPFDPIALEGLDHLLINNLQRKGGPHRRFLHLFPEGKGWLLVEFGADTQAQAEEQAHRLMQHLQNRSDCPAMKLYIDEDERRGVWLVRESGLGATAFVPGEPDTWEGWEDSAVAPEKVGPYLRELCRLYEKYGYTGALYGHFGQGCIHTRITFDLMSAPGVAQFRSFLEEATSLVVRYGGSLSGEHGDGQSKAEFLHKMFGPELVSAFREFKTIWDPDGKMNPGKVVDPYTVTENLRLGANYAPWDPPTHFQFPEDHGSFAHAALRCVGVGKCRRPEGATAQDDVMCPSFMVTREERHSTRGRAHHLWEMLHGGVIKDGWKSEAVHESLDLCLSCKGCKGECPVNVDMATYKAEFLSHYYEGRFRPRQAYAFGWIDKWSHLASHAPGFFNLFTQLPGPSHLAKLVAGIPQAREIPPFAPEMFQSWWKKRAPRNRHGPQVLLWPDTFNNYYLPHTAQAAVAVLEDAGYQLVVPEGHLCCGRPLYDYGFLGMARAYLQRVIAALEPHIAAGTPMVVLEPSCCSVFRDELHGMMPDSGAAQRVMENTFTLSEFLSRKATHYSPPPLPRNALVQGHCHHKAIMRFDEEEELMRRMKLNYRLLNSGCCGMAGSFGYEAGEKYEVSVACGERALLPAVRHAGLSTLIVADGFSCRGQIAQGTSREALHLAEVLEIAAREGQGPLSLAQILPERKTVEQRRRALRASMLRAGLVTLAAVGGLVAAFLWRRRREFYGKFI